ncbi:MAG: trehalose-phosphatase [Actinomycetota bacterium]|nr:trehalose-phosphatase [Actinomycetota bacterium]
MDFDSFVTSAIADPSGSGFILDFDGTLSEIVSAPAEARPAQGATEVLTALVSSFAHVAVLSGRRAEEVAALAGVVGVDYHGLYGGEWIGEGSLMQHPDADRLRGMASRLARDAEAMLASEGIDGCEVEFKNLAVSVHHRNASNRSEAGDAILRWAQVAAERRGFKATRGRMVVELRPRDVSKSSAARGMIIAWQVRRVLFAGDDSSDVEVMKDLALHTGLESCCIGVSSTEEPQGLRQHCDLIVGSPADLLGQLRRLIEPQAS